MLDLLVTVYDETQQLCVAHPADDGAAAVAVLGQLIDKANSRTALMAWVQVLAAAPRTAQAVIDELPWPADRRASDLLAHLIAAAGTGADALLGAVEQMYRTASDDDIWATLWFSSVAACLLLHRTGGLAHWRKIALAHQGVLREQDKADLVYPAAAFVALVSVGRYDDARDQLEDIVIGSPHGLSGLIQLWVMLAARWLRGPTLRIGELDDSGVPAAMIDPADPAIATDRASQLIIGVLDAVGSGDAGRIGAAMQPILALPSSDRVSMAWQLGLSLGARAARWLRPAS